MAEKAKCEICNREFKDAEGLAQHNLAKHSALSRSNTEIKKSRITGKLIGIIMLLAIIGFIVWAVSGAISESNSCKTTPAIEINIGGHKNLALHIHQTLKIIINGKEELIPGNIGIASGLMRPIHTHDVPGELHVEGPCRRDFTLGDFFQIWGRQFNSQCIFNYCTDKGTLTMYVNGIENAQFENLILKDGGNILIEYKSTA